nr:hypothetical protein [Tanacetum cinerariifolium]
SDSEDEYEVLTRSRLVLLNAARPVTTAVPQTTVKNQRAVKHVVNKSHSPIRRPINHRPAPKNSNFHQQVTTVKAKKKSLEDVLHLVGIQKFNFSKYIFESVFRNVDSPSKFLMYPRFLQVMINAQVHDLSSHNTKYPSPSLTHNFFTYMRRIGKGFSRVETPLFDTMLVQPQVQDAAEVDEDEDDELSIAPTPPSPTHAPTSPPPQQEPIPSPP